MVLPTQLMHDYDPQKAHEYYLLNRQLKGRQKGTEQIPVGRGPAKAASPVAQPKSKVPIAPSKKKSVEEEVAALKARLKQLREVLKKLVEEAKARSGVETPKTPKEKAAQNAKEKGSKPQTAAQKRAANKRSKDYYEKHKDKELADLQKSIKNIKEKIQKAIADAQKNSAHKSESTTKPRGDRQNGS